MSANAKKIYITVNLTTRGREEAEADEAEPDAAEAAKADVRSHNASQCGLDNAKRCHSLGFFGAVKFFFFFFGCVVCGEEEEEEEEAEAEAETVSPDLLRLPNSPAGGVGRGKGAVGHALA